MNKRLSIQFCCRMGLYLATTILFISCKDTPVGNNQLTSSEKEQGWKLLFDGKTTDGWHLYNRGVVPSAWLVKDGVLHCTENPELEHGDLVSNDSYKDYDLRFEWQLKATGNSGVFVNVQENQDNPTTWASGPEYQLLGNEHPDMVKPTKRPGCLYGFMEQVNKVDAKPAGEWNQSRIVQENGKITFYLNDKVTAMEDLKSPQWKAKVDASYFKSFPAFGKASSGRIALQDWSKGVAFRNIKILNL
nr:DUF1080 domain-containing protein [Pedobacter panaciterrae]